MSAFWAEIFGNPRPVEIEIGPGTGHTLLEAAAQRCDTNFLGIEQSRTRAAGIERQLGARGLANARVLCADAACVITRLIPPGSVHAYHIYFPDPWWKRRHHRRRLFTPQFASHLGRTLAVGGAVYVATDVPDVFALMLTTLLQTACLTRIDIPRPPRTIRTRFESKGLARGATIQEAVFLRTIYPPPCRPVAR